MQSARSCLTMVVLLASLAPGQDAPPGMPVVYARHLALSPDGQTLLLAWAGDIWSVPAEGGEARRLTIHPASESHPVWSRDGRWIAFASDRHGAANVFVMNAAGGQVRRLTFSDRSEVPTDWSPDGKYVYFHARKAGEVWREPRMYRVPVAGGQSWRILECHAAEGRVSPDGSSLVFLRGGAPWWRRGYRGSANYDLWLHTGGEFRRLTEFAGNDRSPAFDAQGRGVYFLSDRGGDPSQDTPARPAGVVNVWYLPLAGGETVQLTRSEDDDVRDFAVSADGRTLVYTVWDKLYVLSPVGAEARVRELRVEAPADAVDKPVSLERFTRDADEIEASPDGKEIALVVRGEIFVIKTEEGKPTRRVTESAARDRHVTWSPDGKALYFVSDEAGQEDVYRAVSAEEPAKALSDSLRFRIERVTDDAARELAPSVSPDGKHLAFVRGRGDLMIRDVAGGPERCLVESWNIPTYRWSPDSKWIAYEIEDEEYNPDVWVVPADGSAGAVNISQHPDFDGNPQWSADGQILAFTSRRHGMDTDLYFVFLSRELDESARFVIDEYFSAAAEKVKKRKPLKQAAASGAIALSGGAASQPASAPAASQPGGAASKPSDDPLTAQLRAILKQILAEPDDEKEKKDEPQARERKYEYELETAWQRVRRITSLPDDQSGFALAPDGASLVFNSSHEGSAGLFSVKWNGEDRKRISTGPVGAMHWTLNGERLFYLRGGVPGSMKAGGADTKSHDFVAKMAIDRLAEATQKFNDASRALLWGFYHATMKGLDWAGLTERYRGLALRTQTVEEFNEIFNLLQGELNASHMGISGPARGGGAESIGYLGCEFDESWSGPGLRVKSVVPQTPADRAESRLVPGDVILRVDGRPVGPDAALDEALINTVGDEIIVTYRPVAGRKPDGTREALGESATQPASGTGEAESTRDVVIRPISAGEFAGRCYEAWVRENQAYVHEKSEGRVGYLHILGMGEPQFHVFERDLYAVGRGRDGLIIDVRNNGGGWTADWVMAVLNVRRHAYTVSPGGEPGYPQDRLIFYSWTKPATMMCNQYSYSNAEIVSHAFKNLGRGPLVGVQTFGAVISTGSYGLIDGARIRMPGRGWFTIPDGKDMENNGAMPDIEVQITPADEIAGRRPQLDAAIRATLENVDRAGQPGGARP